MTTKRRTIRRGPKKLTPEAIAAWLACDEEALHLALRLEPWVPSPLPPTVTPLGVWHDDEVPSDQTLAREHRHALVLQRQLVEAVGWPDCRTAFEENLREALGKAAFYRKLVEHPELGGRGTGCDPASRRHDLEEAKREVAYRRQLLDELELQT